MCNKEIGVTKETVDFGAIELPPRVDRSPYPSSEERYLPHRFGDLGEVPAFSPFGGQHVARYTTSPHDQAAYLTTKPEVIQEMIDHYHAKIEGAVEELTFVKEDRQDGADTLIISYGIISRSAEVAIAELRGQGKKVSSLVLQTLFPVPEPTIRRAMAGMRKVVVPEMNMGQYVLEIERLAPDEVEVVGVGKMNTTLLSPQEIIERGGLQ